MDNPLVEGSSQLPLPAPLSFSDLLDLAGPGPVPEPQQCRACERPITQTKLLDCLHSVCGDCATIAVSAGPSMDCPTCHLPSRTPDPRSIPDYVAEHFLAVSDLGRTHHTCGVHQDGDAPEPATFYCTSCNVFMCSVCNVEHRKRSSFHSHEPVLLDELTPEMVRVPVSCPSHVKDQLISGFCTTCRVGVCPTCMTGDHHTHSTVIDGLDTSVYAEVCRALDEELARPVPPSKLDGVAETLRTLDALLTAGTANVKTQHAVIDEWARDGTDSVRARAEALRGELVAKWDVCREALTTQRRDVSRRVHAFAQTRNYATALVRIAAPLEVLMAGAFVKQRLSAFRSWLRLIEPCVSLDPITVSLTAVAEGVNVIAHGSVSEPNMSPWQQGRPPGIVGGHACIYIVGGIQDRNEALSLVERYDPVNDAWSSAEPMPTARVGLACAVLENRLYAVGGRGDIVEGYNPITHTWDWPCAALGMNRRGHGCVTLGDHVYAIGGYCYRDGWTASVERYDARSNRWEGRAPMCSGRAFLACAVLEDFIYATGGETDVNKFATTVERYDPTRDCWDLVSDMPGGRRSHAATALDGHLYVIGGFTVKEKWSSCVDRYDPTGDTWESVAPLAVARNRLAAVAVGDRIYAMGGVDRDDCVSRVEAYDVASNAWTPRKPMLMARCNFGACVLTFEEP